ncbi:hypothetical protein BGZ76_006773 [Entomortierella beljakovae]|nr:hypothetical protein BGZ76_006773 [Entomortierella beljakovae]
MEQPHVQAKPEVLIIGAGFSGLMTALLLEQIGIKYHVFERASEVKPLGAAMALAAHDVAALEQLGIYKELFPLSKEFGKIFFFQGDGKPMGQISTEKNKEKYGCDDIVFARPDFYEILRNRVPDEKISFKKKILNTEEKDEKVFIHCADNTSYSGDILIGADGAYSGVRQSMYKHLDSEGLLPKGDLEDFSIGYTVTVGVANADQKKYPILEKERGKFCQVIFEGDSNCYVVTLQNNRIAWGLGTQIPREESKKLQSRSTEWSVGSGESSIKPFRDFASPIGGTMGEIFDATPKELISKIYLEEKLFKTWHHGRTVLIGDACHKLHPAGGQGAANAIHDAIALANCLYAMKDNSEESIHTAFRDYYEQRFIHAEEAYNMSSFMAKILNGQRPQVAWLPLVENCGKENLQGQYVELKDNTDNANL